MNENQWTDNVKELLREANIGDNIYCDTLIKVPYAREIASYDIEFKTGEVQDALLFETDLYIYEKRELIKPRVIIESKINQVTTHDAIVYSYKAQAHKNVTPFIRYGIMIGNSKNSPLPGRLFRHGTNFDFMISFKEFLLSDYEKHVFVDLIKKEIHFSQQIEKLLHESAHKNKKHYFVMQKELRLEEVK